MPRQSDFNLQPSAAAHTMAAPSRPKSKSSRPNNNHNLHQLVPDDLPKVSHDIPRPKDPLSNGVTSLGGSNDGCDGSSSDAANGSEAEEEEEDDDEDNDDDDELGVNGPAGLKITKDKRRNPAGHKKRAFDDADLIQGPDDDDELDYPRKKVARGKSAGSKGMHQEFGPTETEDDDDADFDDAAGDEDDDDIENEEVRAIIQEMEQEDREEQDAFFGGAAEMPPQYEFAEDLDNEVFSAQWEGLFSPLPYFDGDLHTDNDLFSIHPTPVATPSTTPRGSISAGINAAFISTPLDSATENEGESSEEDIFDINALFDRTVGPNKHFVTSYNNIEGMTDTDSDDAELVKYFFSSDSGNETDGEETDGAISEDDEGETTEEEEDLPMPTPRHQSKLRRASIASATATRPQVVRMDGSDSLQASSWLADPNRPIIVIEGTRQTVILPNEFSNPSAGESDYGSASNRVINWEESESETTALPANFDPTLGGLAELDGGALNGVDFFGPPEAFYPFQPIDGDSDIQDLLDSIDIENMGDFGIDSGADSGEAELDLDDLLEMSSSEEREAARLEAILEEVDNEDGDEDEDFDEETCPDTQPNAADLLSIWDKVSVTAFRKRQVQHQQKLATLHMNGSSPTNYSYHKGKERRLSETLTPSKKRKVRAKFLANNRGGSSRQRSGR